MPHKPKPEEDFSQVVHEEWIAHSDRRQYVPITERERLKNAPGWWFSGWRGLGPDMKPLPPALVVQFDGQDTSTSATEPAKEEVDA